MGKILAGYLTPHPPIIISDIGGGEEKKAIKTIEAMKELAKDIKNKAPSTIIVITPHGPLFTDAISISVDKDLKGDFGKFGYWDIKFDFKNNTKLAYKIIKDSLKENIQIAQINDEFAKDHQIENNLDHGMLVPLYFVDKEYKKYEVIHITYGLLSPKELYKFGKIVKQAVIESEEDAVVIASGDLSHKLSDSGPYTYSPYGKEFDKKIVEILEQGDMEGLVTFDLTLGDKAGECGLRSLMILAGVLDGFKLESKVLSYEGPFGVGYCTAILEIVGKSDENLIEKIDNEELRRIKHTRDNEDDYVKLARKSLEYFVKTGEYISIPKSINPILLEEKKSVFVTIKKDGMLRGCIGSTEPMEKNIAIEIIKYAVNAGINDPRFDSVQEEDLDKLVYSVDVLSHPEPITSKEELDIEKYGVIVNKGHRHGLLLPNLEGIESVEEQVSIALRKAGIPQGEDYTMERFEVVRHK